MQHIFMKSNVLLTNNVYSIIFKIVNILQVFEFVQSAWFLSKESRRLVYNFFHGINILAIRMILQAMKNENLKKQDL